MAAPQFMISSDLLPTLTKVEGIDEKYFPNFEFQRGATLIIKEVVHCLFLNIFDFQSYYRRRRFLNNVFDFQRVFRYTTSITRKAGRARARKIGKESGWHGKSLVEIKDQLLMINCQIEQKNWSEEPLEASMEEEFCQTFIINGIHSQID